MLKLVSGCSCDAGSLVRAGDRAGVGTLLRGLQWLVGHTLCEVSNSENLKIFCSSTHTARKNGYHIGQLENLPMFGWAVEVAFPLHQPIRVPNCEMGIPLSLGWDNETEIHLVRPA